VQVVYLEHTSLSIAYDSTEYETSLCLKLQGKK